MNKKYITKSLMIVLLVSIFPVSISFAQDFGSLVPPPTCVPVPGIPCPGDESTQQNTGQQQVSPNNNGSMTSQQKAVEEKMQAQRKALEEAQKETQKKIQDKLGGQTAPTEDGQTFKDLLNLDNFIQMINNLVNQTAEGLRSFFESMFDNAKRFFRIKM